MADCAKQENALYFKVFLHFTTRQMDSLLSPVVVHRRDNVSVYDIHPTFDIWNNETMKQNYCKYSIKRVFLQSYFLRLGNCRQVYSNIQATLRLQAYTKPLKVF